MQRAPLFMIAVLWSVLSLLSIVAPRHADATISRDGIEFQVNDYTTGIQGRPSVSSAGDGSFVVVWYGDGPDGDPFRIQGRRFDSAGVADGTEFLVNDYTTGVQSSPAVSSTDDGSFVVVWHGDGSDGDAFGIRGRRFDATGAPAGTEFQVNSYTTGDQGNAVVSSAADGRFLVVWVSSYQDGSDRGVFAQRYDAAGTPDGTEFQVNSYTTGEQLWPSVSSAPDGSSVVVWTSDGQDGSAYGVYGQRYDAAGLPDGTEFQINTYTTSFQLYPDVSTAVDGSFVVAWESGLQYYGPFGVFGRRYDAAGVPDGTEFQVNTYTSPSHPVVATAPDGSFVIAFVGPGLIQSRRFDPAGAPDGTEFQVNAYTTGIPREPGIATGADGSFLVVWSQDTGYPQGQDVLGQLVCTDADSEGHCNALCPAMPAAGCTQAARAKLDYNEQKLGREKMKLQWKSLVDATSQAGFGDPVTGSTVLSVCFYDDADALVQQLVVDRARGHCAGKDCWTAKGTRGYFYKDKASSADGVSKIGYRAGEAGKGKLDAKGANSSVKGQTALPTGVVTKLTGNTAPTIQVLTSEGFCVTATMNDIKKDDGTRYKAQLR